MTKHIFYLEKSLSKPGIYNITGNELHHALNVLRIKNNELITIFDGKGNYAQAIVIEINKKILSVETKNILSQTQNKPKVNICTAIPKNKRWQLLVEKCTELAADIITPITTIRSVVKGDNDIEKYQRWSIEAAKQSKNYFLPEITPPISLSQLLSDINKEKFLKQLVLVADISGDKINFYQKDLVQADIIYVLIGPEGGFTINELEQINSINGKKISLAKNILRIETAAIVATAIVKQSIMCKDE